MPKKKPTPQATKRAPRKHTVESLGRKLDDLISRAEPSPAQLLASPPPPGPPTYKRESELEAAISRLLGAMYDAESATEAEAERLAPILLPGGEACDNSVRRAILASHIAYRLHDLADRLATDNARRRDLLARLDLPEA